MELQHCLNEAVNIKAFFKLKRRTKPYYEGEKSVLICLSLSGYKGEEEMGWKSIN